MISDSPPWTEDGGRADQNGGITKKLWIWSTKGPNTTRFYRCHDQMLPSSWMIDKVDGVCWTCQNRIETSLRRHMLVPCPLKRLYVSQDALARLSWDSPVFYLITPGDLEFSRISFWFHYHLRVPPRGSPYSPVGMHAHREVPATLCQAQLYPDRRRISSSGVCPPPHSLFRGARRFLFSIPPAGDGHSTRDSQCYRGKHLHPTSKFVAQGDCNMTLRPSTMPPGLSQAAM